MANCIILTHFIMASSAVKKFEGLLASHRSSSVVDRGTSHLTFHDRFFSVSCPSHKCGSYRHNRIPSFGNLILTELCSQIKIFICKDIYGKSDSGAWRDGSVVKTACYSWRVPWFSSKHQHGGSQQSFTPFSGVLMPPSDIFGCQAYTQCTDTDT